MGFTTADYLAAGAFASSAASVALAPKPKALTIPAVTAPTPMPVPGQNTQEATAAQRSSIAAQLARRGRLSTILSQGPQAEPLGG